MSRGGLQRIWRPARWEIGELPAWVGRHELIETITPERLAALGCKPTIETEEHDLPAGWRHAAVLIPFHLPPEAECAELVLVRRRDDAPEHPGEVAFPGGVRTPSEGLAQTALREAEEEAGIRPADVTLLSRLEAATTLVSRFHITPFVATVADLGGLLHQESEILRVLRVPIHRLLDAEAYRLEYWVFSARRVPISFFEIEGETIWGFTARILRSVFDELFETPS